MKHNRKRTGNKKQARVMRALRTVTQSKKTTAVGIYADRSEKKGEAL